MSLDKLMSVAGPVGMGVSAVSGLVGLLSSAAANRRTRREISKQENFLDSQYLPEMNKRYLDTEEAQSFISTLNDRLNRDNQKAEQSAAIVGGTDEATLAAKESNARVYADSLNKLAGMGTAYKQGLKDRYMAGRNQLMNLRIGSNNAASQSGGNVFSNAMSSMGSMAMLPLLKS